MTIEIVPALRNVLKNKKCGLTRQRKPLVHSEHRGEGYQLSDDPTDSDGNGSSDPA